MSSFTEDFKKFVMRGNVVDMAVGVIIGAAFGKLIASLVSDILMPPIGMLLGGVDFSELFINLSGTPATTLADAKAAGLPVISYGVFINNVIYFLIQALAVFMLIRVVNRIFSQPPAPTKTKRTCPYCRSEIDDMATRCPHCTSQL
jgi:large conductance mechanosensitive channel